MINNTNNKIDSFGNFNLLDKLFTKVANKQNTTHRFSTEWRVFIIIGLIAGLITSIISVYSGQFYLIGFMSSFYTTGNILKAVTIVILILIELLTYYSMSKAFKFALKWDALKFLPTAIFTVMVYTLSFYQSTSGLSIQESSKVDLSETINDNLEVEIENLNTDFTEQSTYYKSAIATVKANPSGWSGGKRTILTAEQLKDIKAYNNIILELKKEKRKQIKELEKNAKLDKRNNMTEITSTREKFFGFISVLMAIQVLSSAFLSFAWSQIQCENAPKDFAKSKVLDITMQVDSSINSLWQDRLNSLQQGLSIALNSHSAAGIPLEISTPTNNKTTPVQEAKFVNKANEKQKNYGGGSIGFKMQNSIEKKCAYCGTDISDKKHWNAKYCSDECKKLAWEKRTGQQLRYKKKK